MGLYSDLMIIDGKIVHKKLSITEIDAQYPFKISISVYDKATKTLIKEMTVTFKELIESGLDVKNCIFKPTKFKEIDITHKENSTHFGIRVSAYGGLNISEGLYISSFLRYMISEQLKGNYILNSFFHLINRYTWYEERINACNNNNPTEFNNMLDELINKYNLTQIFDLHEVKAVSGIYLMVLDNYNICYLGQSNDIKKRISRHWSRVNYFTGTGIDLFRAKDITRIYALKEDTYNKINALEYEMLNNIPLAYKLNILSGGSIDYIQSNNLPLLPKEDLYPDRNAFIQDMYAREYAIWINKDRYLVK